MTAQLSREQLDFIVRSPECYSELESTMARMLLAGMDSEPVAMQNFRDAMEGIGHIRRTLDETFGGLHGTHCEPDVLVECKAICDAICEAYRRTAPPAPAIPDHLELIDKGRLMMLERSYQTLLDYRADSVWYWQGDEDDQPEILSCPVIMSAETLRELLAKAAPPAPVAVPDIGEFRIFTQAGGVKVAVKDGKTKNHLFGMGWNACRAAILKAGPVTAATVPDGWKLVPVEPTAEMISLGIAAHYEASQSKIYDRPVPGPMESGYMAMLAAAPAAPEQEV